MTHIRLSDHNSNQIIQNESNVIKLKSWFHINNYVEILLTFLNCIKTFIIPI